MLFTQFHFPCTVSEEIKRENKVDGFSDFNVFSFNLYIYYVASIETIQRPL
jgi:hypothetical protein